VARPSFSRGGVAKVFGGLLDYARALETAFGDWRPSRPRAFLTFFVSSPPIHSTAAFVSEAAPCLPPPPPASSRPAPVSRGQLVYSPLIIEGYTAQSRVSLTRKVDHPQGESGKPRNSLQVILDVERQNEGGILESECLSRSEER
jgi:hypothetical protein